MPKAIHDRRSIHGVSQFILDISEREGGQLALDEFGFSFIEKQSNAEHLTE